VEAGLSLEQLEQLRREELLLLRVRVDGHVVEPHVIALDDQAGEVDLFFLPSSDHHGFHGPQVIAAVEIRLGGQGALVLLEKAFEAGKYGNKLVLSRHGTLLLPKNN